MFLTKIFSNLNKKYSTVSVKNIETQSQKIETYKKKF